MMQTTRWEEAAKQQQEVTQVRRNNVQTFTRMWLSLGADVLRAANNTHADEINEALGIAAGRWSQLLDMEAQVPREEARLATMERGRAPDPADEFSPKELLDKKDKAHRERVEGTRSSLKQLKEEARRVRRELESFQAKRR